MDSYSLYVCAIVIQVTELCMPLWFCCSLWNFKQYVAGQHVCKMLRGCEDYSSKTVAVNDDYKALNAIILCIIH